MVMFPGKFLSFYIPSTLSVIGASLISRLKHKKIQWLEAEVRNIQMGNKMVCLTASVINYWKNVPRAVVNSSSLELSKLSLDVFLKDML